MIEFKNVSKSYGEKEIVKDFSLHIKNGEFVSFIGSSGSGKTTLLKMINALIVPSSGDVFVRGKSIKSQDEIKLRRSIGYCLQGNGLFPHLNVYENIAYVLNLSTKFSKRDISKMVDEAMSLAYLESSFKGAYISELSGGQAQRVGIARSLVAKPEILLLDEPFSAVDEITRAELQTTLKDIHQTTKATIVLITHDVNEALKLSSRVLVLNKGKKEQFCSPKELVKNPANEFVKKLLANQI